MLKRSTTAHAEHSKINITNTETRNEPIMAYFLFLFSIIAMYSETSILYFQRFEMTLI